MQISTVRTILPAILLNQPEMSGGPTIPPEISGDNSPQPNSELFPAVSRPPEPPMRHILNQLRIRFAVTGDSRYSPTSDLLGARRLARLTVHTNSRPRSTPPTMDGASSNRSDVTPVISSSGTIEFFSRECHSVLGRR